MRAALVWLVGVLLVTHSLAEINTNTNINTITNNDTKAIGESRILPSTRAIAEHVSSLLLAQSPQIANLARSLHTSVVLQTGSDDDIGWCVVAGVLLVLALIFPFYHHIKDEGGPTKHSISSALLFIVVCVISLTVEDAAVVVLGSLVLANIYFWQALVQLKTLRRHKPILYNVEAPATSHLIAQYLVTEECNVNVNWLSHILECAMDDKVQGECEDSNDLEEHPTPTAVRKMKWIGRMSTQPNVIAGILHLVKDHSGADNSKITLLGIASVLFDTRDPKCVEHASKFVRHAIAFVAKHPDKQTTSSCLAPVSHNGKATNKRNEDTEE